VEDCADLGTAGSELVARSLDVGDDQVQTLGRAGRGRGDVRAELDRTSRTGWRELDDPKTVVEGEVGVESPPELRVERLRSIDVRDGMTTASNLRSTLPTLASRVASSLRTSVLLIAASRVVSLSGTTVTTSQLARTW